MAGSPDAGMALLESLVEKHPNFPIEGVLFHDVFPIFRNPKAFEIMIARMVDHITKTCETVDAIVGLDARGFLLGPTIAARLNCAFVPIRKKGKLPGKCVKQTYGKEYGEDVVEIQEASLAKDAKVVIVDDLLATGGTLAAATALVKAAGGDPILAVLIVGLPELNGASKVSCPCFCLMNREAGC